MPYNFMDLKGHIKNIEDSGFDDQAEPIFIFMGGLFNLAGHANGSGLMSLLGRLGGAPQTAIFYIQEKKETSWEDKIRDCVLYDTKETVSPAACDLADKIFLPPMLLRQLERTRHTPEFSETMKMLQRYFSRFTLMGYSYGNSLVRQIETCVMQKFKDVGISEGEIKSVLQCAIAIDIGPTYKPRHTANGMVHLITVSRSDMMAQELCKFEYPKKDDNHCVTAQRKGNSIILIPEKGTPTVRALIKDVKTSSGRRILFDIYEEAHDLFMYTNMTESIKDGDKVISTYASLPTASLVRSFNTMAITASWQAARCDAARNGPALLDTFQSTHMNPEYLQDLGRSFAENELEFIRLIDGHEPNIKESFWKRPAFMQPALV